MAVFEGPLRYVYVHTVSSLTSICPVTAADMRAARSSFEQFDHLMHFGDEVVEFGCFLVQEGGNCSAVRRRGAPQRVEILLSYLAFVH